jgi:hypothetical protein
MPITPEPPSNIPLSSSAPWSFEEANRMIQEAWKVAFPSLRFPVELVGFFPSRKSPLVAAPHKASDQQRPPASMHQSTNLKVAINKNLESQLLKEQAFLKALKATVAREQTESTPQTRRLLAAFAASHPQVSVMYQETLIALARYTFLLEVQAQANCEKDRRKLLDFCWLNLENVASCSPSASSLTNWVTELAQEQFMIFSAKMENYNVFCQSGSGQKGQEVRLYTLLDENDKRITEHGSICQFWAGLTYTGKTSAAVAKGTNHLFQKFGHPSKKISGCCGDSGAGTPESYANSLAALGIWHQHAAADSCGLHDLQSAFWPALQHFVGVGGLELRNTIQLLHTMFALCKELKKGWKRLLGQFGRKFVAHNPCPRTYKIPRRPPKT